MNAPIIIFAFNRIEPLRALFDSLRKCPESKDSEVYVFVDGARTEEENIKVQAVKNFLKTIEGFKRINLTFSDSNKGLGPSIIRGVSEVISVHGCAIVIEDDLVLQPNFLRFMNDGLEKYADEKKVYSICGYSNKIKAGKDYGFDAYFGPRSSSWGWATWSDRWESVDWTLEPWSDYIKYRREFNKWGGSDCFGMLEGWKKGINKSWAIRFCFSQFLQDKLSVFPIRSLVKNDGFDGNGTNCKKWSRFKYELFDGEKKQFRFPDIISCNQTIIKQALSYNGLMIRIWSRIMYLIFN